MAPSMQYYKSNMSPDSPRSHLWDVGRHWKSMMASVYLAAGLIPSSVMRKPANSTSRLAKRKTWPFLLQCDKILHILLKEPVIDVDKVMTSSIIFLKSFTFEVDRQFSSKVWHLCIYRSYPPRFELGYIWTSPIWLLMSAKGISCSPSTQ
jgi:hypothetical protein